MKQIGELLRRRREELGYTLSDIHVKTKLSEVYLKAIEDGNLDYFKHDFSYLKFFIQYYCQAVGIDFNLIKDEYQFSLDEYAQTQVLKREQQKEQSNQNIQQRIAVNHQYYVNNSSDETKTMNTRLIALVGGIILFIVILIFVILKFI